MKIDFLKIETLIISAIILLSLVVWLPYTANDFLLMWDDTKQIFNADVETFSLKNVKAVFSSFYVRMYQPLSSLVYMLLNTASSHNPHLFHTFSIALHLLNIWLVYLLLKRFPIAQIWRLLTVIVFAVHPLQQEPVSWASGTSTLIFSTFYVLSMLYYIKYNEGTSRSRLYYCLSVLFFALSCLSKANAVVLPLMLIGLDYLFFKPWFSLQSIKNKLPYFGIALVFGLIVFFERAGSFSEEVLKMPYPTWSVAIYQFFFLLAEMVFFNRIIGVHGYPKSFPWVEVITSVAFVVVIIWYAIRRKSRLFWFALLFYFGNLIVVSSWFSFHTSFTANRYMYLPMIGILLGLSVACKVKDRLVVACAIPIVAAMVFVLIRDRVYWKNDYNFCNRVLTRDDTNIFALSELYKMYSKERNEPEKALECIAKVRQDKTKNKGFLATTVGFESSYYITKRNYKKALEVIDNADGLSQENLTPVFRNRLECYKALGYIDKVKPAIVRYINNLTRSGIISLEDYSIAIENLRDLAFYPEAIEVLNHAIPFASRRSAEERAAIHQMYYFKAAFFQKLGVRDSVLYALNKAKEAALTYNDNPNIAQQYLLKVIELQEKAP